MCFLTFPRRILAFAAVGALCLAPLAADEAVFPGSTWERRSPASVGLDGRKLNEFVARVGGDGCIIKDGYLVKAWGEVAASGDWGSAAKPMLSTLLLLAVQEGKLTSVNALVKDVGWELTPKDSTMTFRHLANMVSGYARGEAPGAAWAYNDSSIELFARSLEKVFQQPLDVVCRQHLAALQFEDGTIFGTRDGRGVEASPRDYARIGWLWLNRGQWKGRTVIAEKLFTECVRPGVPANLPRTSAKGHDYLGVGSFGGGTDQRRHGPGVYGFNFWFNERMPGGERVWPAAPADTYQANGHWNRDTVTVFPRLGMVVAMRGADPGEFEPGKPKGKYNQNLKRLMDAVRPPTVPGKKRKTANSAAL